MKRKLVSSKAPSVHVGGCNRLANLGDQAAVQSRRRPPVRTVSAAVVPKRGWPVSTTSLRSRKYRRACWTYVLDGGRQPQPDPPVFN
jgi:hypothetical protein